MEQSDKIKEIRARTGLSQTKFSEKYGIPVSTLQDWERGVMSCPSYVVTWLDSYVTLTEAPLLFLFAEREIPLKEIFTGDWEEALPKLRVADPACRMYVIDLSAGKYVGTVGHFHA
jgi:putative transcriptional regulator